ATSSAWRSRSKFFRKGKGPASLPALRVFFRGAARGVDTHQPRVTRLSGRLLPERTIRRGHATVETTRHRITSFRFVEHEGKCGVLWHGLQGEKVEVLPVRRLSRRWE